MTVVGNEKSISRQVPRSQMSEGKPWKSSSSNHAALIYLADWKHCVLSTQPNTHLPKLMVHGWILGAGYPIDTGDQGGCWCGPILMNSGVLAYWEGVQLYSNSARPLGSDFTEDSKNWFQFSKKSFEAFERLCALQKAQVSIPSCWTCFVFFFFASSLFFLCNFCLL